MLNVSKSRAIELLHNSLTHLQPLRLNRLEEWRQSVMVDLGTIFGDNSAPAAQFRRIRWHSAVVVSLDTPNQQIESMSRGAFEDGKKQAQSLLRGLLRRVECIPDSARPVERPPKGINVTDDQLAAMESAMVQDQRKSNLGINSAPDKRKVFVVHGRNASVRKAMFQFLRALGLDPLEWGQVVKLTGKASPFIGDVLDAGFKAAQAVVVLLTGDDEARLIDEFQKPDDKPYERDLTPQPRPNVLFEAGMAFGFNPDRTLLIEIGDNLRPFSDISGRHVLRFDGSPFSRQDLKDRLVTAGCEVADDGRKDWQTDGDFTAAVRSHKGSTMPPRPANEYVDENGVHWKRKPDNTFEKWAYCPNCNLAMSAFPPYTDDQLLCSKCNFQAPFRPSELELYRPK